MRTMSKLWTRAYKGYTVVELLITVAIVGLVALTAIGALSSLMR